MLISVHDITYAYIKTFKFLDEVWVKKESKKNIGIDHPKVFSSNMIPALDDNFFSSETKALIGKYVSHKSCLNVSLDYHIKLWGVCVYRKFGETR